MCGSREDVNNYNGERERKLKEERGRVFMFSTRRNMKLLGKSVCWFLDRNFNVIKLLLLN